MTIAEDLVAVSRLTKDVRDAGYGLGREEARELVDLYYRLQKERITLDNQSRALTKADRPHTVVDFVGEQFTTLEKKVMLPVLDKFSMSTKVGQWSREQKGVGPVIAAGFLSHIDIEKAPTVGHIWRFAGLDPTVKWYNGAKTEAFVKSLSDLKEETVSIAARSMGRKPETILRMASTKKDGSAGSITTKSLIAAFSRRPWNADLKVLCWKLGDSFVKVKRYDDAFYSHLYTERKLYELHRDGRSVDGTIMEPAAPINQACAAQTLLEKNFQDKATKEIYESGHLPVGRLDNRARRWAVKIFLSHWHHVAFVEEYGENPPKPYILTEEGGHAHYIAPPGF